MKTSNFILQRQKPKLTIKVKSENIFYLIIIQTQHKDVNNDMGFRMIDNSGRANKFFKRGPNTQKKKNTNILFKIRLNLFNI
jgi:hypothetical protein